MSSRPVRHACLALLVLTLATAVAMAGTGPGPVRLAGYVGVPVGALLPLASWDAVQAGLDSDRRRIAACLDRPDCGDAVAAAVADMVRPLRDLPADRQVAAVHELVNRVPYAREEGDGWQTPLAFLGRRGDCEDYALAKYLLLRMLGHAEEELLVVVVDDVRRGAHAVLAVAGGERVAVLDSLSDDVLDDLPRRYRPLYAVNGLDRWVFATP